MVVIEMLVMTIIFVVKDFGGCESVLKITFPYPVWRNTRVRP
jgi:uncharacterized protein YceK